MNPPETKRWHIHGASVTPETTFKRDDLLEPVGSSLRQLRTDSDVEIATRAFRLGLIAAEKKSR